MDARKHPRPPRRQCIDCASLSGKEARKQRKLYDPKAPDEITTFCWDERVCPGRRHYHQNAKQYNAQRCAERAAAKSSNRDGTKTISVPDPSQSTRYVAYLYVYRAEPKSARTHAIAGSVYDGQDLVANIEAFHCGQDPSWVEAKVEMILFRLRAEYGIRKFESIHRFDPIKCPLRPCPLHPGDTADD